MSSFQKTILTSAIIGLAALTIAAGLFWHFSHRGEKAVEKENNITFVLPEEIVLAGESIPLTWTDNNEGENLIIQSDRKYYDGRDSSEVYFSITNMSGQDQKPDIQFLFDEKEGRGIKELALLNSQNDVIASGQTNFYKAIIYFPQNSQGEFFIEAKGNNGGYGLLDPYYAGGLVGMWSFSGSDTAWTSATAGTTNDLSGNNNTGTMTNMSQSSSPAAGISGQALKFDGALATNDYVLVASASVLENLGPLTISVWANANSYGENGQGYFASKSAAAEYKWRFQKTTTQARVTFAVQYDGTTNLVANSANNTLTASDFGKWIHWVAIWDGTALASGVHIYKNGADVTASSGESDGDGTRTTDVSHPIYIGNINTGTSRTFDGTLDEVRVYNRALSSSEITDLYRIGAARLKTNTPITQRGAQSGLVGNWTFNGPDMNSTATIQTDLNWPSDTYYQGGFGYTGRNYGALKFTCGATGYTLTKMTFDMYKNNPGTGHTLTAYIYSNNGSVPGTLQGTAINTIDPDTLSSDSANPTAVDFYFSGVAISANTTYWGVIQFSPLTGNEIRFGWKTGGSGVAWAYSADALSWTPEEANGGYAIRTYSGLTAYDRSGQGNNGVLVNSPSPVPGVSGQALSFDGVDDYVSVPSSASIDNLGTLSVSTWIYPLSAGEGEYGRIFDKCADAFWTKLGYVESNIERFVYFAVYTDVTTMEVSSAINSITFNAWNHVVFTYDNNGDRKGRIYINGSETTYQSQIAAVGTMTSDAGQNLVIGNRDVDLARTFDGSIDEVRVYDRALTASEITDLYRLGAARMKVNTPITQRGSQSGLVGNWTFNGPDTTWSSATAGTTNDVSGNGNTGTMTNMSQSSSPAIGVSGQALKFDGSNDYVAANGATSVISPNAGTFSAWIYIVASAGTGSANPDVMSVGYSGSSVNGIGFYTIGTSVVTLRFLYYKDSVSIIPSFVASLNTWYHIVGTWDASNVMIYSNGILADSDPQGDLITQALDRFYIGSDALGSQSKYFNGLIDEVRVYNRALSASEITDLYKIGAARVKIRQ